MQSAFTDGSCTSAVGGRGTSEEERIHAADTGRKQLCVSACIYPYVCVCVYMTHFRIGYTQNESRCVISPCLSPCRGVKTLTVGAFVGRLVSRALEGGCSLSKIISR